MFHKDIEHGSQTSDNPTKISNSGENIRQKSLLQEPEKRYSRQNTSSSPADNITAATKKEKQKNKEKETLHGKVPLLTTPSTIHGDRASG